MSFVRVPRPYKVFRYGKFLCELPSRKETAEYMVDNYFWDICSRTMYGYISDYSKGGSKSYYGFAFEKDPDWVPSKPVRAIDDETGKVFVKSSVCEMGKVIFSEMDSFASTRYLNLSKTVKNTEV